MGGTRMLPQAMSPGADHACVLFSAGWKGLGRSPQAASVPLETKTSADANAHRRRAGGRAGTLNHGPDAVKTQLATSPTNRRTPKMIT